jgi:DNA repair and recombination protein RAD52
VDNLHRHPDYAPAEKESAEDNSKKLTEDIDLPPRPAEASLANTDDTMTFEADAEFGSMPLSNITPNLFSILNMAGDLFDEVDLVVTTAGSPDEIICLDPDPLRNQQRLPPAAQARPQGNVSRHLAQDIATASKPENSWIAGPTTRQQPATPQRAVSPAVRQNMAPNHPVAMQRKAASITAPQQYRQNALVNHAQSKTIQESVSNFPGGLGPETSNNPTMPKIQSNDAQGQIPQGSPLNTETKLQTDLSKGFYSARAVDMLRENPTAPTAPQFDPRFESPSIRKTVGVDHSRSLPITRPMLAATTSTASSNRTSVNPSADMHRKIGAPNGNGISNPIGRGQSTSLYRPLTRPNTESRNNGTGAAPNGTSLGMGGNGKRPPLDDVTNATPVPAGLVQSNPAIQKRHRVSDEESPNTVLQQ